MSDVSGGDPMLLVEGYLEGEDDQHSVDIPLHQANAMLLPCPELGTDEEDNRHSMFAKMPCQFQVNIRKIDEDSNIGRGADDGFFQFSILAINARQVPNHFRDAHDGNVLRVDDSSASQSFHSLAPHPEEFGLGGELAKSGDQESSVVLPAGLSSGEEDSWCAHLSLLPRKDVLRLLFRTGKQAPDLCTVTDRASNKCRVA